MDELRRTKWFSWLRLGGLAVTTGLLCLIFKSLDASAFARTMRSIEPSWVGLALVLYGCGLALGGARWHLALRLTGRLVHAGASMRLVFIGHFFYVLLFGAAGGDVAKSALYARWFRYPLPEVLAAAPLDRGFGSLGLVTLTLSMLVLSGMAQGFENLSPVNWDWGNTLWLGGAIAALMLVLAMSWWRPNKETPWSRALHTFKRGIRNVFQHPRLAAKATACALGHQLSIAGVFALGLCSVTAMDLPWAKLAWTIPAITILSCFPVSVAGAGVREVAAVTLLGLYDVPVGDAVAAAMVTLAVKLSWAGIGGFVFWREQVCQTRAKDRSLPATISVIIPTYNEENALPATLRMLGEIDGVEEIIVVDGGSSDQTVALAKSLGCRVLLSKPGRGHQLRLGAEQAVGEVIVMLHADTWMPADGGHAALSCLRDRTVVGGGFWKSFRHPPSILLGSRFKCATRLWIWNRIAGDQAMFVRRDTLRRIGGIPDMPLMEEFALCERLTEQGRLALAGATIQTSARRFREHGALRTYLLMGWIHLLYRLGYPSCELKRIYDRGRLALPGK